MTAGQTAAVKPAPHISGSSSAPGVILLSTSDLMLHAHQIISLEATQRETILWEERKDIATLHVSLKRVQQLDSDRILQQQRRFEAACDSRIRTIERKLTLLDGEEQKLRLAILKSEVLQLEAIVRQCTKSIRGEVFSATQDAQQRIKYFNKTLDIILKKEAASRRDILGMERYEFLVAKQRSDKEVTETQRESLLMKMRLTKQQQHDQERRRQEEAANHNNSNRSGTVNSRYSVVTASLNTSQRRKSKALSSQKPPVDDVQETQHHHSAGDVSEEATRHVDDEEMEVPQEADEPDVPEGNDAAASSGAAGAEDATADEPGAQEGVQQGVEHQRDTSPARSASSASTSSRSRSRSSSPGSRASESEGHDSASSVSPARGAQHATSAENKALAAATPTQSPRANNSATHASNKVAKPAAGGKQYQHVAARVVVGHRPEFLQARLRDITNTEDLRRLKVQVAEYEAWDRMYRRLMYVVAADDQRRELMDTHKAGGDTTAQVRCVQRAMKRLTEEELHVRQALELDYRAGFDGIVRKVQRTYLSDQQDQRTRLAKLASHQNRVARRLQKLSAERAQLSEAAKESLFSLDVISPNEADQQLAAIGESQPYPAILPPAEGTLHAAWSDKVSDIELKRRKFIERESMLRRMVLQIYHRQKMKDFGFFDESKMRDDQMKLAAALRGEEAAETLRQLHALDERIATAQLASQQRFKAHQDRERLFRDEHAARAEIAGEYNRDVSRGHMEEWKLLQRRHKGIDFLVDEETLQRQKMAKDERNKRDILLSSFKKFRPTPPRKPAEPLPVPPPKFEDAVQVYQEFFKKNPYPPAAGTRKLASADPESRSTYFSTAGRKYLPPAKKTAMRTGEQTLMAFHRNKTPTTTAREDWNPRTNLSSSAYASTATATNTKKAEFQKVAVTGGSFYYTTATSANTTINFGADLAAEQSAELSSSVRRSIVARKPRPPPRDVCLASMALQQAAVKKRNDKVGARLEPIPPSSERPAGLDNSGRASVSSREAQSSEGSTRRNEEHREDGEAQSTSAAGVQSTSPRSDGAGQPQQDLVASSTATEGAAVGDHPRQPTVASSYEESPGRARDENSVPRSERTRRSTSHDSRATEEPTSRSSSPASSRPPSSRASSRDRSESPANTTTEASPERPPQQRSASPSESPQRGSAAEVAIADNSEPQGEDDDTRPPAAALDAAALEEAPASAEAVGNDEAEPSPAKSNATQDEYGLDEFEEDS